MKTNGTAKVTSVLAAMIIALSACNGQAQEQHKKRVRVDTLSASMDTPKTNVRVNKQYDAHGNLITYDSTYSSFYSGRSGEKDLLDSLFRDFRPRFGTRYPFLNDPGFNDLFFNDTTLYPDFFHQDFFRKRMELNDRYMQRMMAQMDSVKNEYFRQRSGEPPHRGGTQR